MPRRRRMPRPPPHGDEPPALPTLDLHGETAEGALRRTQGWLRSQRGAAALTVRVVTGRGAHSAGPPVLRGEIGLLLERLRGTDVDDFVLERGGGSFRVELLRVPLRPSRPAAPRSTPRPDPAEVELRRRAEEALAELGVAPTPALLRAEMRRLRDFADGH